MTLPTPTFVSVDQMDNPLFGVVLSKVSHRSNELHRTLFVTHDEQAAHSYVEYQTTLHASMREKVEKAHKDQESWKELNPRPVVTMPECMPLPDWTGVKVITNKMRAERRRLKEEYSQLVDTANAPLLEWFTKYAAALNALKAASLTAEENIAHQDDNCNRYRVENLSWMPPLESILPTLNTEQHQFQ